MRKTTFVVRKFGICVSYQSKEPAQTIAQDTLTLSVSALNAKGASRGHSRQPTRSAAPEMPVVLQSLWIMFADIDFIY